MTGEQMNPFFLPRRSFAGRMLLWEMPQAERWLPPCSPAQAPSLQHGAGMGTRAPGYGILAHIPKGLARTAFFKQWLGSKQKKAAIFLSSHNGCLKLGRQAMKCHLLCYH